MNISSDILCLLKGLDIDDQAKTASTRQQLDRKTYLKLNKVLEALGGKWNRKAKAHIFPSKPSKIINAALGQGEVTTNADIGYFPTSEEVANLIVDKAGVRPGDVVLEPSAGTGAIAKAVLTVGAQVYACESEDRFRDQLYTIDGLIVLPETDCFDIEGIRFDVVTMNPPFAKDANGHDALDHVRKAHSLLVWGGFLVSVVPAGVKFREDRRHTEFREWYAQHDGYLIPLPDDAFKKSGTSVRTHLLLMGKHSLE